MDLAQKPALLINIAGHQFGNKGKERNWIADPVQIPSQGIFLSLSLSQSVWFTLSFSC